MIGTIFGTMAKASGRYNDLGLAQNTFSYRFFSHCARDGLKTRFGAVARQQGRKKNAPRPSERNVAPILCHCGPHVVIPLGSFETRRFVGCGLRPAPALAASCESSQRACFERR